MVKIFKACVSLVVLSVVLQALGVPHALHHYLDNKRIARDRELMIQLAKISDLLAARVTETGMPASTSVEELLQAKTLSSDDIRFLKENNAVLHAFHQGSSSNAIVVEIPARSLVGLKRGIGMRASDAKRLK